MEFQVLVARMKCQQDSQQWNLFHYLEGEQQRAQCSFPDHFERENLVGLMVTVEPTKENQYQYQKKSGRKELLSP